MSAIKAGDLVMVVRPTPCCGGTKAVGKTYTVSSIITVRYHCDCGARGLFNAAASAEGGFCFELSRLIRIDPPALPESVETDREVTA